MRRSGGTEGRGDGAAGELTWASSCKGSRFQQFMLQLRWMYQSPGLSPDLDLVVSQPVPTHIRSPFSQRLHQNPAFGGRGLRRTRPFFSSASKAMLHLRLVLPGSAGPDQVPEDSSTVICFPSGSFGRRTIDQDPVHRVLPQGDEQLSRHCYDR